MKFKYPKLCVFVVMIILAYITFRNPVVSGFISHLDLLKKMGSFFAGMFYSFGFTGPFAAGFFLALKPSNIILTGIIGGLGAMFSDLIIFKFVKVSFADEFMKLKEEKIILKLKKFMRKNVPKIIRRSFLYVFAFIFIASPLPDETGVIILAGLTKIKARVIAALGFIFNTIGIILLLLIGKAA